MSNESHHDTVSALEPAPSPNGAAVPYILCLIVFVGVLFGGWKLWQVSDFETTKGNAIPQDRIGPPLTEFELTERSGKPFRSLDMRGRVWVASYFFTTCPGQCKRLNANIQILSKTPELKEVTWVSITCDPDNDTLDALRAYADLLQADPDRWLFCRGDFDYTQRVARGMNLYMTYKDHQDHAIVIDKAGKVRGLFDATSGNECQRMKSLLIECLAEKPPNDIAVRDAAKEKSS